MSTKASDDARRLTDAWPVSERFELGLVYLRGWGEGEEVGGRRGGGGLAYGLHGDDSMRGAR